jgi:hypothetical protein
MELNANVNKDIEKTSISGLEEDVNTDDIVKCCYCGHEDKLTWVHGHGQCANCKTNIDECCRGENLFVK